MSMKGPFGLSMGMTLKEVGGEPVEISPGKYRVFTVPKPHSAFDYYVLQITPSFGLSWIKTIGRTIETSVYGIELQGAFDSMEKKLSTAYGKGRRSDFLMRGSIWNEPRDWTESLLSKERCLMTEWSPAHGSVLPSCLASVALLANVIDKSSGYIVIEYSFENSDAADAEMDAAEDDAL